MEKEENQNSNSDSVEEIKDNEDTDKSTEKSEDLEPENKIKEYKGNSNHDQSLGESSTRG